MLHKNICCTVYLIRHAESEQNVQSHLVGGKSLSVELSERGKQQANAFGERLVADGIKIDVAYTSMAKRAYDTACIALAPQHFPKENIVQVSALDEIDQGDWEAEQRGHVYTLENLLYIIKKGGSFAPPHGESQEQVRRRATNLIEELFIYNPEFLKRYPAARIALFSHAITIKSILQYIMNFDQRFIYKMHCYNTSLSECSFTETGWGVIRINDVAHLQKIGYLTH